NQLNITTNANLKVFLINAPSFLFELCFLIHQDLRRSLSSQPAKKLIYDLSTALSSEVLIKVVENRAPPLQAGLIIFVSHCDAGDEPLDPNRVLPPELRILEIDVVNNLSERAEAWIVDPCPLNQDLQCAAITF